MNQLQNTIDFMVILTAIVILFKFKQQITGQTGNSGTKHVEIKVP